MNQLLDPDGDRHTKRVVSVCLEVDAVDGARFQDRSDIQTVDAVLFGDGGKAITELLRLFGATSEHVRELRQSRKRRWGHQEQLWVSSTWPGIALER